MTDVKPVTGTPGQALHDSLRESAAVEFDLDIESFERWEYIRPSQRNRLEAAAAAAIAAAPQPAPGDAELLKRAADALAEFGKIAITVEHWLDKPYEDDPRWSPWTRWVERPAREAHDLAMVIRKRLKAAPGAQPAPELAETPYLDALSDALTRKVTEAEDERDELREMLDDFTGAVINLSSRPALTALAMGLRKRAGLDQRPRTEPVKHDGQYL